MTEVTSENNAPEVVAVPQPRQGFPLLKGIVGVIALSLLGWGCFVWATGTDGFDFRRFALLGEKKEEVVPFRGKVLFNGKPIDHGHLEAYSVDKSRGTVDRIIAPIKEDGTFEFFTDIKGTLSVGVPVGDYKVLLKVYYPVSGFADPDPMLPPEFYDVQKTPIVISVTSDPKQIDVVLEGTGEIVPQPAAAGNAAAGQRGNRRNAQNDDVPPTEKKDEPIEPGKTHN
jgi:hypothetical protein